jgi:SAM-dependent methyltransferase
LFYRLLDILLLRAWHIHRELRNWKRVASPEANILDAGSGFGQYSWYMSRMSARYTILGLDVKDEQVADCNHFFRELGTDRVSFRVGDLLELKDENKYDLVLCVDVMEHIEEDVRVMSNYCRSLKPGGMLMISTPSDQGGSDVHEDDESSFIEEHVRDGYGVEDMKSKLQQAGFSRSKVMYSYGKPGQISWRLSMKYPLLMLNVSKLFFVILPFYYVLVMPLALLLNYLDSTRTHASGTGLIVLAWK